jgi:trimethylamine:corrinoid methyltransferase-like protein
MRDDLGVPHCFDYTSFATWQRAGAQSVLARAEAAARDILSRHTVEPLPALLCAEIRRIATA